MRIGIDIDDTITDSYEVMFNYAQEFTINTLGRSGNIIENNSIDNHYYARVLHNWTLEEETKFWKEYYEIIMREVKPKTLAAKYIQKLKEEGHTIILITARFRNEEFDVEELTKKWLEQYQICYDQLIVDAEDKLAIAEQEKIDVFIDDSYRNCSSVATTEKKVYLMDSRLNKQFQNEKIKRIYSWPHFYQELGYLGGEK